jgi:proline iminopeptidase
MLIVRSVTPEMPRPHYRRLSEKLNRRREAAGHARQLFDFPTGRMVYSPAVNCTEGGKMDRRNFLLTGGALAGGLAISASGSRSGFAAGTGPGKTAAASAEIKTGGSHYVPVRGGKYNVWVERVGEGPIKVLLLHGGPGFNHVYLRCFQDFLPQAGIEFYFYDQLGCLFSDNPDDPSLWTVEGYRDEVEDVRRALGLEDFYLFGHSWGGMLTYEYALQYPAHLRGIVISNMVAGIPGYVKYVNKLRDELPPDVVRTMKKYEAKGDYEAPEYQQLVFGQFYAQHVCRINPWPAPVEAAFKFMNAKVYNTMQGPNEFIITGTFKNWDRTADLAKIKTRALVMGARYDEMDPGEMRRIATRMPNARAAISERGSHLSMYDDQEWYFRELTGFLTKNG